MNQVKICYFYGLYFWAPEKRWDGPDWLAGIENASKQPAWMGRIEIIYFGPQIDLSSTPKAPKRAGFAPKLPPRIPWRSSVSANGPYFVPIATGQLACVGVKVIMPLYLIMYLFVAAGAPKKGPVLIQKKLCSPLKVPEDS